jgi:hypothetical protein
MRTVEFYVVSSGLAMSYTRHLQSVRFATRHRASCDHSRVFAAAATIRPL